MPQFSSAELALDQSRHDSEFPLRRQQPMRALAPTLRVCWPTLSLTRQATLSRTLRSGTQPGSWDKAEFSTALAAEKADLPVRVCRPRRVPGGKEKNALSWHVFSFWFCFHVFSSFSLFFYLFRLFSPSGTEKISETRDVKIYHSKKRDNEKIQF